MHEVSDKLQSNYKTSHGLFTSFHCMDLIAKGSVVWLKNHNTVFRYHYLPDTKYFEYFMASLSSNSFQDKKEKQ